MLRASEWGEDRPRSRVYGATLGPPKRGGPGRVLASSTRLSSSTPIFAPRRCSSVVVRRASTVALVAVSITKEWATSETGSISLLLGQRRTLPLPFVRVRASFSPSRPRWLSLSLFRCQRRPRRRAEHGSASLISRARSSLTRSALRCHSSHQRRPIPPYALCVLGVFSFPPTVSALPRTFCTGAGGMTGRRLLFRIGCLGFSVTLRTPEPGKVPAWEVPRITRLRVSCRQKRGASMLCGHVEGAVVGLLTGERG